jgi:hypothetical protein
MSHEPLSNHIDDVPEQPSIVGNEKPVKILKKRGRKPSGKVLDIKNIENKNITSSLDPEKECFIIHLPLTTKDINNLNNKKINENVFIDEKGKLDKITTEQTEEMMTETKHESELALTNELYYTENSDSKKKCYNCTYLSERCNALHVKLQEVTNIKNIQDTMENKIHDCKLNIVDSETCKWKEATNIWCWWCVHPFTNSPFGLPIKFDNNTYQIQGCFCSLNCAKAYNVKENNYRMSEVNSLIEDFRRDIFGVNSYPVTMAPPRQTLRVFGGYLTIEDFRKEFFCLNKNTIMLSPTVAPVRNFFEEEYHDKIIRSNNGGIRPKLTRKTVPPQSSYNLDSIMQRSEEN